MRMLTRRLALVAAALVLANCSQSASVPPTSAPTITRDVTTESASASNAAHWRFWQTPTTRTGLAGDHRNRTWYFSSNTSISNITSSGHVTTYPIPVAGTNPVIGNDGAIWFLAGTKIGRFSPPASSKYFDLPGSANIDLFSLTPGFGDDVWFTARTSIGVIEHMTSNGAVTTYPVQPGGPNPCPPFTCTFASDITRGPDGKIWFDGFNEQVILGGAIGKINPATGAVSINPNLPSTFFFTSLTLGPDKRMWGIGAGPVGAGFPQCNGVNGFFLAVDTNFASAQYPVPCQYANGGLLVGGRDALFAAVTNANPLPQGFAILRVATNGKITATYTPPGQIPCCPNSMIVSGPDQSLWFSTPSGIGVFKPSY